MCSDISRWRDAHIGFHHESKVSTFRLHRAAVRADGWTPQPGSADFQTIRQGSHWRRSDLRAKRGLAGSADVRKPMRQVSVRLTANWSTSCRKLHQTKWRLERQWLLWPSDRTKAFCLPGELYFVCMFLGPSVYKIWFLLLCLFNAIHGHVKW